MSVACSKIKSNNTVITNNIAKVKIIAKNIFLLFLFSLIPMIKIIFNPSNLGFTKAHNLILKELIKDGNKYIFLLNNDTVIPKKSIEDKYRN